MQPVQADSDWVIHKQTESCLKTNSTKPNVDIVEIMSQIQSSNLAYHVYRR